MNKQALTRLSEFITERENIRMRRAAGQGIPWTKDSILQAYSFCNINREHDAVTRWIAEHFRPKTKDKGIAYAVKQMAFCRIFNEPKALSLACPLEDLSQAQKSLERRQQLGMKVFRGAYIMPAHETKGVTGIQYWFRALKDLTQIEFGGVSELRVVAERLMTVRGFGDFIANQICADLRYVEGLSFTDWGSFVLCGPGTRRGLNRLHSRPTKHNLNQRQAVKELLELRVVLARETNTRESEIFNDPNNVANSLCEYDKYQRVADSGGLITLKRYGRNKNQ